MAGNSMEGLFASSSSRRVYFARRFAIGCIFLGILLFFTDDLSLWVNLLIIAAGVVIWWFAGLAEGRRRQKRQHEADENGNAVKKVL